MKNFINSGNKRMNCMNGDTAMERPMAVALHDLLPPTIPSHEGMTFRLPPHIHESLVTVLYDVESMKKVYGENYVFRIDQLARETPEMKIIFALIMGFKISVNVAMIEALLHERSRGIGIKFDNFTSSQLDILAERLGVEAKVLSVILNPIPEGVAVVIMSMIKEK